MRHRLPFAALAAGVVLAALFVAWLGAGHIAARSSALDRFESVLLDFRITLRGPRAAPGDVVIVAIDDDTVAAEGGYPLDRARLAVLADRIATEGAAVLAIDLLLVDETPDDAALAAALGRLPTVIAGAGVFTTPPRGASAVPQPGATLLPAPEIAAAAAIGFVNVATDAGGTPRHVPLIFITPQGPQQALALRAASLFSGSAPQLTAEGLALGDSLSALDVGWHLPLNPYGPRGTFETVSAGALLEGTRSAGRLDGRLVLLGATATGVGDRFSTPFDRVLPGVEVLATGVANLLDGSALVRDRSVRRTDVAATLGLVLAGLIALTFLPTLHGSLLFVVLLSAWLAIVVLLFRQNIWLSGALPVAGALPPVLVFAFYRLRHDRRFARSETVARTALSRFQAPALSRIIVENPDFLREPVETQAAILFVDLSGFTSMSERTGPADTREILAEFHHLVVELCERNAGIVLSFMGDGAMLGFGLLDGEAATAPRQAVTCAFDLDRTLRDWIAGSAGAVAIAGSRIGLHYGPVVLSRLGHDRQQHIAATGDTVNVASRLSDMCKDHGAALAVSAPLLAALPSPATGLPAPSETETLAIRGRREPLEIAFWRRGDIANPAPT